jgi:two-component system phosphate regulon sensor histidine kinase PhoR
VFRKLFLAYLAVLVLALGVFGALSARSIRRRVLEESTIRVDGLAEMLKPLVRSGGAPQATLVALGGRLEVRLTVIGGDGTVLADSHGDAARMDDEGGRPEVQYARTNGQGTRVRYSETDRSDVMYHASLVDLDLPKGRVVRAALPLTRMESELRSLYGAIAIAFLGIGAAGAGLTYLAARWIRRPLREIQAVAQAIAEGGFAKKVPLHARDEFGSVAIAMNRMAEELSARMERLAGETSKLDAVLAGMQEGVIAVGGAGEILHANASARSLFGLRDGPLDLKIGEAVRVPALGEGVRKALRDGVPWRSAVELGPRAVALSFSPLAGGRGGVLVSRDVTEEKRYDDLRREFVANVSHELRTPLTLVKGYVETLAAGAWRDGREAPGFLRTIEANIDRLCRIVEDLLELSKLESGGLIAQRRPVDLGALLAKVCETFRPLAERKGQALALGELRLDRAVEADPDLLERAISNLVDNAIKYTPERGRIRVDGESGPEGIRISVEDNGIGIPEPDLPRVFERFYRVDKSRSRDLGGTGLGLAIVKHVAQLHGGSVTVRSRLGRGSTFTVQLPGATPDLSAFSGP